MVQFLKSKQSKIYYKSHLTNIFSATTVCQIYFQHRRDALRLTNEDVKNRIAESWSKNRAITRRYYNKNGVGRRKRGGRKGLLKATWQRHSINTRTRDTCSGDLGICMIERVQCTHARTTRARTPVHVHLYTV